MKLSTKTKSLPRSRVRYILYSLKNGNRTPGQDSFEIEKYFESLPEFPGFSAFAVTWDVSPNDPFMLIKRRFSVYQEWNTRLRRY